jgi:hypothetical protein
MVMCPCHRLTYVGHGEVALPSLLVDLVEAVVVLPELPPRPPPLPSLRRLLFLFLLSLLGGRDDVEGCNLGARVTMLV